MDTETFLSRVVPTAGNYLTTTWKSPGRGWAVRSFTPHQISQAAHMLHWASAKGADTYFAVASYNMAEVSTSKKGAPFIQAKREQANVRFIRALVMDADCKRAGDNKDPAHVFADRKAAITWLLFFCQKTKIPRPNLGVNSGYGLHWYWLLEDPITLQAWQPLANALKAAMLAEGWVGDTAPTIDAARIMRAPMTMNYKAGQDAPAPVKVEPAYTRDNYPNAQIANALAPWMTQAPQAQARTGTHGGATVSSIGARPSFATPGGAGINKAAHAGLQSQFKFSEIAKKCLQVKKSLANGGLGDPYPVWFLGNISLSIFTPDGKQYAHGIGKGDPRYTQAGTDAAIAQAEDERAKKGLGAPTCAHYDGARPGVCQGCPFYGKIKSPISLGIEESILPERYRAVTVDGKPRIEHYAGSKKEGDAEWVFLVEGAVASPILNWLGAVGGHRVSFTYSFAGKDYPVSAVAADMNSQTPVSYFERQGVVVNRYNVVQFGDFCMAWITKLRTEQQTRTEIVRPFGWNFDEQGERVGLGIAGTVYKANGTEIMVPGGDPKVAAMYRPSGDIKHWRKAAALFEGGRADLQALIAASFGAPLISLCGDVRGMSMNFWSTESGIGKTTAIKVAHSVWGDQKALQSMRDTPNAVMRSLSEPRILPRFWDELRVRKDYQDDFVELIFTIPQGKERARLQSDTTLREVGEWETMLIFTSNRSCTDYLLARDDGTDSGLARLLEVELAKEPVAYDPVVGQDIKAVETNYGHAGRIFAKHIATNTAAVNKQLADIMRALASNLAMQRDERFTITAMACVMVGAIIATKLGLFKFDVAGINTCLTRAFLAQREQRARRTILSVAGGFDLEEIIGEYVHAQADFRLRTTSFSTGTGQRVQSIDLPRGNVIRYQIAESLGIIRISRAAFIEWLRDRNRPADTIIQEIKSRIPGTIEQRKALGAGTGYSSASTWVLDIPCLGRLAEMLGTSKPDVKKAPAHALADDITSDD